MPAYSYEKCTELSRAVELMSSKEHAFPFAGGTDLLVGIRGGKFKPQIVVDIKGIAELNVLKEDQDGITIGAGISLNEIAKFEPIREKVPILAEGCHSIGTFSIRNRGTLVGNICNASPAADTAPPLYCLDAKVNIFGPEDERTLSIEEFFVSPGKTALRKGELVTSVLIPRPYPEMKGFYQKASRTRSVDLATVNVAVQRTKDGVRIALGAVAPTPVRAKSVEKAVNQEGENDWEKAAGLVKNDISPISDLRGSREYRYHLAEVLVRRGLQEVMGV